jgi:hypothetical protein
MSPGKENVQKCTDTQPLRIVSSKRMNTETLMPQLYFGMPMLVLNIKISCCL